jgi:exonuclease III
MPENLDDLTCNYYLPNDFAMTNGNITDNKNLLILNLNIRSIANKFDSFRNLLSTLKQPFSIISLTETWLNDQNSENFHLTNFDFVCSNRANKKGGGVGIFISNNLNYKLRTDLNINEDGIVESLFIEIISTTGKNIIVGTIYRPPSGNFEMFEIN